MIVPTRQRCRLCGHGACLRCSGMGIHLRRRAVPDVELVGSVPRSHCLVPSRLRTADEGRAALSAALAPALVLVLATLIVVEGVALPEPTGGSVKAQPTEIAPLMPYT